MKQRCQQCGFEFHLTSQRFYCCKVNEYVCSTCRRKPCPKCKKPRTNEILIPKCNKCYCRFYENDLLLQNTCGRYYCSKCLSDIFKQAYIKVRIEKLYEEEGVELAVRLYCGHEFMYEQIVQFFQHFCLSCGRQYDTAFDYELNDGVKLCFDCFRYYVQILAELFIKCQFCASLIKNSSIASVLDNSEIPICQKCTLESKIEQDLISESRKVLQLQNMREVSNKKQQKRFPYGQDKIVQRQEQKKPSSPQKQSEEVKSAQLPAKSVLSKLFKKPSITQLKQKQQKRIGQGQNNKSNSVSITSRFSNNFEQIDKQVTQSLGLPADFKLKKHLSNQTYVENFAIQVKQNNSQNSVKCRKCFSLVDARIVYDLYSQKTNQTQISSISLKLNGSFYQANQQACYFICRGCYFKSAERQKSILNMATSTKHKSSSNNRPSKLQQNTFQMDFLKPGKSARKDVRSPSPSPNKHYSLTGSKQPLNTFNQTKPQIFDSPSHTSTKKLQPKPQYPVSRQTLPESYSIPAKQMKCDLCRNLRKTLIVTANQGHLCDDCYYRKNFYLDAFSRR